MTLKIAKSQMFEGFEVAVAAHAFEMKNWRSHMVRVAADEAANVAPIDRHVAHPRPGSHPLVEACVNENDVADYEIVDDWPTPAQFLAAKKYELLAQVSSAEQVAIASVLPHGKRRLFQMRENDIRFNDAKLASTLTAGLLAAAATAVGLKKPVDIEAELEKRRLPADTSFLGEQLQRRLRVEAIERAAAQMHHDIEDLTLDTIEAWKITPFPD